MLRKICNILTTILLVLLAILAAAMLFPNLFGCKSMAVLSGSMEPNIPVGSIVYTGAVEFETLEPGDVISYYLGDSSTLVTHRVVSVDQNERTVVTKGDANAVEDGAAVPESKIMGRVLFHLPFLGYISIYCRKPVGIAVACGVFLVLILLNFLPDVFEPEEEDKDKKTEK